MTKPDNFCSCTSIKDAHRCTAHRLTFIGHSSIFSKRENPVPPEVVVWTRSRAFKNDIISDFVPWECSGWFVNKHRTWNTKLEVVWFIWCSFLMGRRRHRRWNTCIVWFVTSVGALLYTINCISAADDLGRTDGGSFHVFDHGNRYHDMAADGQTSCPAKPAFQKEKWVGQIHSSYRVTVLVLAFSTGICYLHSVLFQNYQ